MYHPHPHKKIVLERRVHGISYTTITDIERTMIEWETCSKKERTEFLLAQVLHWEHFESWQAYLHTYGEQEWSLGAGKSFATPTPVAYYDEHRGWRVFSRNHESLETFDPLHTMKDTWTVLDHAFPVGWSIQIKKVAEKPYVILENGTIVLGVFPLLTSVEDALCLAALICTSGKYQEQ